MNIWVLIILIILGVIVLFVCLYLILGAVLVRVLLGKKGIGKRYNLGASNLSSPFYKQVDLAWFNDPLIFKIVSITSFDNHKLSAHFAQNPKGGHRFLIYVHGWAGNPDEESKLLKDLYEKHHFHIVSVEQRAQMTSNVKLCTLGIREALDLFDWISYFVKLDPKAEIALYGVSMGAATLMLLLQYPLPSQVKCVIEDAGYCSVYEELFVLAKQGLPSFLVSLFVKSATANLRLFHHLDIVSDTPLNSLKKGKTPILLIHGDIDQMVPFSCLDRLYDAVKEGVYKQKEVFPNATHGLCAVNDYGRYYQVITAFLDKFISK